jgi:hypothetical protein
MKAPSPLQQLHPLKHKWVWSYKPTIVYKQQTAADWLADYKPLMPQPFSTVEEFWSIYSHVHTLNDLDFGNIYSVFREGILPVWEHPANEHGYSIVLYVNRSYDAQSVAKLYEMSLLLLIGNSVGCSSLLNGCTFERKAGGNKIVFWLSQVPDSPADRMNQVKQILMTIGVQRQDVTFCDSNSRIDWRDSNFAPFKMAVACKLHKLRVTENNSGTGGSHTHTAGRADGTAGRGGAGGTAATPQSRGQQQRSSHQSQSRSSQSQRLQQSQSQGQSQHSTNRSAQATDSRSARSTRSNHGSARGQRNHQ